MKAQRARITKVMGRNCFSTSEGIDGGHTITFLYYIDQDFKKIKHGDYRIFNKEGVLLEKGRYRNNKRTGSRRIYKENAVDGKIYLYSTIEYRGGKRSGPSYGYYPNGAMRYIMNYSGSKIIGTAVSFSVDGKLIMSLSTTVTNKTTDVLERTGVYKVSNKCIHGLTDYSILMDTLKKFFDDVHYEK